MTKKEFLRRLENELRPLATSVRNDILNEYENHINEGVNLGESEEAVVDSLGDPSDIAGEVLSIEKISETETDQNYVTMQSNHVQDIDPKDIDIIDVQGDFLWVEIIQGRNFEMNYESPDENSEFSHGVNGNELIFKHRNKNAKRVHFNILKILRNRNYRSDKLTIIWPENLRELKIKVEKGSVDLTGLTARHFDVRTELGSIIAINLVGVRGDFKSEMGTITLKESMLDHLEVSTEMGSIKVDDVSGSHQSYATEMGAIDMKNTHPDANIDAQTNMGAIKVEYKKGPFSTQVVATAKMGSVANQLESYIIEDPEYTARFTTSMGSINIQ